MRFSDLPVRLKSIFSRRIHSRSPEKGRAPSLPIASVSPENRSPLPVGQPNGADKGRPNPQHSARRINRIAARTGAKRYLEIGVSRGLTFQNVQIARKVGVDPSFRCDVAALRAAGSELHEVTSDNYFASRAGSAKFDVVFLDGLHQFHQTFRDFCNSLCCTHERSIWIIDDVFPVDVYSSLPNQEDAVQFRRLGGVPKGKIWHGDVFKVVFAIHDFFPMMSYVTIFGSGNPQTIVWRATRPGFSPLFNGFETIERLTYFDVLKKTALFNPRTEEQAFLEIFPVEERSRRDNERGNPREFIASAG